MGIFLEVKQLTKHYEQNPQPSLNEINFQLKKNQTLALMGESGSGKTTLLRLIAGLEQATTGQILLNNQKVIGPKEQLVAGNPKIRLVNQNLTLPHSQTIASSISYQLKNFDASFAKHRTKEIIEIFKLEEHQHKTPNQLSGGQKQRALFAWAISDEPPLLLLDEPLSHLDDMFKKYIYERVFNTLYRTHTTIIFATHQAEEVFRLADKMLILQNGNMLEQGVPESIYRQPNHEYSAILMGESNIIKADNFNKANFEQTKHSFHKINQSYLIRPQQLKIVSPEEGFLRAVILKITFMGSYYETLVKVNHVKQKIVVHSLQKPNHEIDSAIGISW